MEEANASTRPGRYDLPVYAVFGGSYHGGSYSVDEFEGAMDGADVFAQPSRYDLPAYRVFGGSYYWVGGRIIENGEMYQWGTSPTDELDGAERPATGDVTGHGAVEVGEGLFQDAVEEVQDNGEDNGKDEEI